MQDKSTVPSLNREWLATLRRMKNITKEQVAFDLEISESTYNCAERGGNTWSRSLSESNMHRICKYFGLKTDMFYYNTDEEGRLTASYAFRDIAGVYASHGFTAAILNPRTIIKIFAPTVADQVVTFLLPDLEAQLLVQPMFDFGAKRLGRNT